MLVRTLLLSLLLALLLAACSSSRMPYCTTYLDSRYERDILVGLFNRWDLDDNDRLDDTEFEIGIDNEGLLSWAPYFDDWDEDASGTVEQGEFFRGWQEDDAFAAWDADEDGYLDPEECPAAS